MEVAEHGADDASAAQRRVIQIKKMSRGMRQGAQERPVGGNDAQVGPVDRGEQGGGVEQARMIGNDQHRPARRHVPAAFAPSGPCRSARPPRGRPPPSRPIRRYRHKSRPPERSAEPAGRTAIAGDDGRGGCRSKPSASRRSSALILVRAASCSARPTESRLTGAPGETRTPTPLPATDFEFDLSGPTNPFEYFAFSLARSITI